MPLISKHPRIAPTAPPFDDDTRAALDILGPPIALFGVFARRPDRAHAIAGWGRYYLSRRGALSLRHRELAIDRTTALCGAGYEWGIHIAVYAGKAGLTDEQVASLATGDPADACWTDPADRAVLATVDALHQRADLDDAEWQTLLDAVGEDAAVDLLLLCGWYHAISFAVNALRLPAEPGTPALPTPPTRCSPSQQRAISES